ncbi:response regulator [Glaciecola sp. 2405UD65-10]|uniref:response regulator n=1 Tax=Glaciecola sp. 2405UD65-10 TaxID=3397244 RepID=UPI003B5CA8A8
MNKHRILIVDDSPSELRILMELLKNTYAIVVSTNGEQAIDMIKSDPSIELVLLDVVMPGKNGYETCKEMLAHSPNLPIVFVSSNDSTEEILTGFDSGGVDYLTKPIDTDVVSRKVKVILNERNKIIELQSENESSNEMVMSVITNAGHLGTVLGYLRAGLKIKTHEGLLSALFDVFDILNVDACVQLRTPKKDYTQSTNGAITPLELDLLARSIDMKGRFLERGSRYIVNFETVSVIIKNMPVDDVMVLGDLRDNLMMIMEDTNALNEMLCATVNTQLPPKRTDSNSELVQSIVPLVDNAATLQKAQKSEIKNLIEDMGFAFEQAFISVDLSEQQQSELNKLVVNQSKAFSQQLEQGLDIEDWLTTISEKLNKANKS